MNLFKLSLAYLTHKKLQTFLSILIMSFGILMITLLLILNDQLKSSLEKNIEKVDMVVGAKGSPMQIILSSLFQIDFPTGNISLKDADYIAHHRLVKNSIPLSAGDSYKGFRIIGTNHQYYRLFELIPEEGRLPENELEVVLGNDVAADLGLQINNSFISSHGFAEDGSHLSDSFRVVGILQKHFVIQDKLIFTPLESYWHVHDTDTSNLSITNLLLQYRNPMAAVQLPRIINRTSNLQAAMPSFEISRLYSMLGIGSGFLHLIAFLLVGIAALSIFISMYSSMNERLYDMAIMRAIGATRPKLFTFILLEGIIISLIGAMTGVLSAHLILIVVQKIYSDPNNMMISGFIFDPKELFIIVLGVIAGVVGAIIPAIQIYKTDISVTLSES